MNFKKVEDTKLLLTAIADEIKKDPAQAIVKIEKLQQQIPNSYEGFRTKEELKKAGFQ
jgi:Txe/YoeB family toxin of Txe-Axe toxin-antitoxin module